MGTMGLGYYHCAEPLQPSATGEAQAPAPSAVAPAPTAAPSVSRKRAVQLPEHAPPKQPRTSESPPRHRQHTLLRTSGAHHTPYPHPTTDYVAEYEAEGTGCRDRVTSLVGMASEDLRALGRDYSLSPCCCSESLQSEPQPSIAEIRERTAAALARIREQTSAAHMRQLTDEILAERTGGAAPESVEWLQRIQAVAEEQCMSGQKQSALAMAMCGGASWRGRRVPGSRVSVSLANDSQLSPGLDASTQPRR
eukprot:7378935-Prymnesium_polylepis.1